MILMSIECDRRAAGAAGRQKAATSIEKQKMSNRAKAKSDATKRFDVRKLKGPKS